MADTRNCAQLIAIIGPTASGKTDAAAVLAAEHNGVVINTDAQQVYKGLPLLTAQPLEGGGELFGFLPLDKKYSSAQYAMDALCVIERVFTAGRMPILVGGTGFYLDALLYERDAPPAPAPEIRAAVSALSSAEACARLCALDACAPFHIALHNPRRVSRALEIILQTGRPQQTFGKQRRARFKHHIIAMNPERALLRERILRRVYDLWERGAVEEVMRARAAGYSLSDPGMRAIGVREVCAYLDGSLTRAAAQQAHITATWQYARRQMTWYNSRKELWHSPHDFPHKNLPAY